MSLQRHADGYFERGGRPTRLEAFVDAAFAFAVTLLVISIDAVPANREELLAALKGVPAFAASFAVIAVFWWDHNVWSRRFGLDDGVSVLLSLILVFLVLVYVYPLKAMFSAMFDWMSGGWLASGYQVRTLADLQVMFQVYAAVFTTMGLLLLALHGHAWRQRDRLQLDATERAHLRGQLWVGLLLPCTGLLSFIAASLLRPGLPGWAYSAPGTLYFLLVLQPWLQTLATRGSKT